MSNNSVKSRSRTCQFDRKPSSQEFEILSIILKIGPLVFLSHQHDQTSAQQNSCNLVKQAMLESWLQGDNLSSETRSLVSW